ncbi:MAG: CHRD domain-containing protein [Chloroflexota bacterium]|nr:CHRD domain-containing protein [Chloroflexota bacterium]
MHPSHIPVARSASLATILAVLAMMLLLAAPVAADASLSAELTGAAEVCEPADTCNDPEGSGTATVDITTDSGEICVTLEWSISDGTASAAHIHEAPEGEAGDVVLPLFTEPDDDGMFEGCFTDATLAAAIEESPADYYINVHSETYPNGAVRGQLAAADGGETGMLMIMKHYCNADDSNPETTVDVRSEEEFMEVEAGGGGNPVIAVALTILACPVERLPGDEPAPDSIAHFEEEFDFLVTDSTGATFTLADATFNQALVCEQDKEVASGPDPIVIGEVDGDEATNVCVDFSFYSIDGVAEGEVTVTETFHEGEHEFGTVRFTPAELDPDDDSRTLIGFDRETSTVVVDTSLDDDGMTMLHIYNFDTAAAAPAPTASTMPDTSVESAPGQPNGTAATVGLLALLAVAGGMVGYRVFATKRTR